MPAVVVAARAGLPDARGWGWDWGSGWAGELAESVAAELLVAVAERALHGAVWVADWVWVLASRGSVIDLSVQAETYALTRSITIAFFVGVLWWAIGAAAVKGDVGLVGRRLFIDAPKVVVGSTALLAILSTVTVAMGEVEGWVVRSVGSERGPFEALDPEALDGFSEVSLVAAVPSLLVALAMIVVSLGLALFLMVRVAALNLLVVFVPLAMLAMMTPYAAMARLIMEKFLALLLSKTVILICLAVAGNLITNLGEGEEVWFAAPAPAAPGEVLAEVDEAAIEEQRGQVDGMGVLGTMLSGLGILIVAAFSPAVVFHLIPAAYHDSSPYSGSEVGSLFGGHGHAFRNAQRTGGVLLAPFTMRRRG